MKLKSLLICLCCTLSLLSCDENLVATSHHNFEKTTWSANTPVVFQLATVDSLQTYDVFLHLRNNKDYAYKNLWLITQMKFPQGKVVTDTLQYAMADARGAFLGQGSDVVENKLVYKRGFRFRESGTYQLTLQQAMRKSGDAAPLPELKGVLDIGYTIEKQTQNGNE